MNSDVKSEGLEVVAWVYQDQLNSLFKTCGSATCAVWNKPDGERLALCNHSEALAGYAVRDARVAELEEEVKTSAECLDIANELYETHKDKSGQLRAELAKSTAHTAELEHRCGVYGLELHNATERLQQSERQIKAIKAREPVAWAYKEYVWVTGLGGSVWRDQLETSRPDPGECEVKDIVALYAAPVAKQDEKCVHTEHCCADHGCKYCQADCPIPEADVGVDAVAKLLPLLDEALEDLAIWGRHSDQGYRKLKDWYRQMLLATSGVSALQDSAMVVPDIARFEKHAIKAKDCLSECDVVLLSSIRRLLAASSAPGDSQ